MRALVSACVRLMKLAIVGAFSGTHVGGSLLRAAATLRVETAAFDCANATRRGRVVRAVLWRFADRRPPRLDRFSAMVVARCMEAPPDMLIATGTAPLTASALRALRAAGVRCANYSTDDPWNPALRARWFLKALPEYDVVFSTRRANLDDLRRLGCRDVRYLPFGYDEFLFPADNEPATDLAPEVLFVGGADRDRVGFVEEFVRCGPPLTLVGGYWERYPVSRPLTLGHQPPEVLRSLTVAAKVNLCLVRRANRDGHVMRSFEIAALGGCMLVEDTDEHREIFGPDGEAVLYFRTPHEAGHRARALLRDASLCARLSRSVKARIRTGDHRYRDRLVAMIEAAG